ncbi:MAG: outer membrane beta-barrel protein [Bacteroidales bacterium]|jgi:hypothetical protein
MKTKNLLFLILLLGISFDAFSQKEVTIKQVITSSLDVEDNIYMINIETDCPVTIKSGKENVVYLTGNIAKEDAEDYKGFCTLSNNVLMVESPYKDKKKYFKITIELANKVNTYSFGENSKVTVKDDIISENSITFTAEKNSEIFFEGRVKIREANIITSENSKMKFSSLNADNANIVAEKGSILELNGEISSLQISKNGNAQIKGNYKYDTISDFNDTDDLVNIIKGEVNETEDAKIIVGKNVNVSFKFEDIKEDYISNYPIKGFEDGEIKIQDDYPLNLEITLRKDIGNITIKENSNVVIKSEINAKERVYDLSKGASLSFEEECNIKDLSIELSDKSKVKFKQLNVEELNLNGEGSSELEINGNIKKINRYKYDDINITGNNTISEIRESKFKMLTITAPYIDKPFTKENENKKENKNLEAQKLGKDKVNFSLQVGYGILGWSNRVSSVDDLFSSPSGQYSLKCGSSWNLGFRYEFKLNRRWTISTGLGYESDIFRFKNNVMLSDVNGEKRIGLETNPSIDPECKLVARYITLPLFVKFRVAKNFAFHVGAIGGLNFRTSSTGFKRDYDIPHGEVEERWGANYANFKPVKLDVQAGFGWGDLNFYARYSLTPLFKTNTETEVYPYSVGISFGL